MSTPTAFDVIDRLLDKQESMEYEIEAGKTALEEMSALADLYAKESKAYEQMLQEPVVTPDPLVPLPSNAVAIYEGTDSNRSLRYQIATIRDELAVISTGMSKDEMIHRVKSVIDICDVQVE